MQRFGQSCLMNKRGMMERVSSLHFVYICVCMYVCVCVLWNVISHMHGTLVTVLFVPLGACTGSSDLCVEAYYPFAIYYTGTLDNYETLFGTAVTAIQQQVPNASGIAGLQGIAIADMVRTDGGDETSSSLVIKTGSTSTALTSNVDNGSTEAVTTSAATPSPTTLSPATTTVPTEGSNLNTAAPTVVSTPFVASTDAPTPDSDTMNAMSNLSPTMLVVTNEPTMEPIIPSTVPPTASNGIEFLEFYPPTGAPVTGTIDTTIMDTHVVDMNGVNASTPPPVTNTGVSKVPGGTDSVAIDTPVDSSTGGSEGGGTETIIDNTNNMDTASTPPPTDTTDTTSNGILPPFETTSSSTSGVPENMENGDTNTNGVTTSENTTDGSSSNAVTDTTTPTDEASSSSSNTGNTNPTQGSPSDSTTDQVALVSGSTLITDLSTGVLPTTPTVSPTRVESSASNVEAARSVAGVAVELPSSGTAGPGAGTVVGAVLAGLLVTLLLLFLASRRRRVHDDPTSEGSVLDHVKHVPILDAEHNDDDDDNGNNDAYYHDDVEGAQPMEEDDDHLPRAHVINEDMDSDIEASYMDRSRPENQAMKLVSPYDEEEQDVASHAPCSSPTCEICERARQQGTGISFVRSSSSSSTPRSALPSNASRSYAASDTVDL
jgi:hypothetical protein